MKKCMYAVLQMKHIFISILLSLSISSCAHVISGEYRNASVKDLPFSQLIANPDVYLDKMFIFGGFIAETNMTGHGTEIEVVQSPLDRFGNVKDTDVSEGRFILTTSRNLDPLIYRQGREIAIAGILTGSRKKMLGDIEYIYPVFDAKEIKLWKEEEYCLYPDMYPCWYGPFYYRSLYYPSSRHWDRPHR
jgi:outer membrane lipoprotein